MGDIRADTPSLAAAIPYDGGDRPRGKARRWTLATAFALMVHAAPFLAMLVWPMTAPPPRSMTDPVIYVELAPPAAPPVPPSEKPPGPKQRRVEAPKPKAVPELARPPVDIPPLILPAEPPDPTRVEAKKAAPETTAPPARPAPQAAQASSGMPTWQGLVLGRLNRFKRYPSAAQFRRQQGVPYIRFVIDRDGKVLSSRLERSSGYAALDAEAVALPKRAQPLPKPPDDVGGATLELVAPVEFFLR